MSQADRWQRVGGLCQAALDLPAGERAAFLRDACNNDDDIRREVETLLAQEAAAGRFLETSIDAAVAQVMQPSTRSLSGQRLGAFEVGPLLGRGGMGEVYRAHDTQLSRDVALKVLPDIFALDPHRLARFTREAQVLAALNHPNVAAIYGLEESNGVRALVLELVEGPTLADRIAQGAIPLEEALPIARQMCEGLEAAHEQGIVHRDLKPANIKLRPDGTVKVLDFGLARVFEAGTAGPENMVASTPTSNPGSTQVGLLLGTAAYMSPEQAKGRQADKRSDVWAFGAVFYEMLSGQRAYEIDAAPASPAIVLHDIDWTTLPASTPASIRRLIARCLDRDVRRRLRDIGEARFVLEDPQTLAADSAGVVSVLARPAPAWRRAIQLVLVAIVIAVVASAAGWYLKPSPALRVTRFRMTLPEELTPSIFGGNSRPVLALSPDGAQMVYVADERLYLRSMSELDVRAIHGSESHQTVTAPVFSPDGRSVAFWALGDRTLKTVAVSGGAAVTICPADNPYGIDWGPDGIVFGQGSKGIMRVSPNGGAPEVIVRVNDGEQAYGPQLLPGGQHLLFTLATGTALERWDSARIIVLSLTSGERKTLVEGGSDARYVSTGHLVYAISGSLFARPFDMRRLVVTGEATPVVTGVGRSVGGVTGAAHFSVSSAGSLVYVPGPIAAWSGRLDLALVDRNGRVERLNLPVGLYLSPRASPDGTRIVFGTDDGKEAIVWTYKLSGSSAMQRLTVGSNNRFPIWSSDSRRIVFQSDRDGDRAVFWQPADGTGPAERLTTPNEGEAHVPESWSPTADSLLLTVVKGADMSLWTFSLQDRRATPFGDVHSSDPTGAVFSPDGRWVAYTSTDRGRTTIYVQPFPSTGAKYPLFAKGSDTPHEVTWSPDGRELFFNPRPGGFEAVSVTTEPTFAFGKSVEVPRPFRLSQPAARRSYDVTPEGKFLGRIESEQSESAGQTAPQIQVVLNWFEELRARVPPTK